MKASNLNLMAMASALALIVLLPNEPALAADGCPAPNFAAPVVYARGTNFSSATVGDFNADGKLDLVAANSSGDSISLWLGNGDGSFQTASNYIAGALPVSIAVGDFQRDGKLDLVVADFGSGPDFTNGGVSVLLGKGDGTYEAAISYGAGKFPQSVAAGDFNGDEKPDLAVANFGSDNVSVSLGNGNGTFQTASNYGVGKEPYSIAVGDFNGDGKLDLAVANSGSTNISVLLGNDDGTFRFAVDYGAAKYPQSVAVGDFNADGMLDLVVSSAHGSVSVLLGKGDGSFKSAVNYSLGTSSRSVAVSDFNGDDQLDLAVAISGAISVLVGNGDGTFQTPARFATGAAVNVAVGDLNGDGKPDLAVTSTPIVLPLPGGYGVSVLLNTCPCAGVHLNVTQNKTHFILSWPLPYANFFLESTTDLSSTNWQGVAEVMTTNYGRCEVTVPLGQGQRYFRLRKP